MRPVFLRAKGMNARQPGQSCKVKLLVKWGCINLYQRKSKYLETIYREYRLGKGRGRKDPVARMKYKPGFCPQGMCNKSITNFQAIIVLLISNRHLSQNSLNEKRIYITKIPKMSHASSMITNNVSRIAFSLFHIASFIQF